jgi:hypothetical protein
MTIAVLAIEIDALGYVVLRLFNIYASRRIKEIEVIYSSFSKAAGPTDQRLRLGKLYRV